ncbi:hypothetical protein HHK36_019493 [Tetracentron sinense]|uniref:Uncharacterized protein n=1 Tax=Tetracentron sinense TaxID=13715 RepID=A0A834YXG7_TETSI|nr:hypothetical protein HHK36_019493 [Tetracentron sinense]
MGYIYEAIDRAKEAIKEALGGQRNERKWDVQLHQPLHAAGYYLNPEFFYANSDIDSCEEVVRGLLTVIKRLVPDLDAQDAITRELVVYRNVEGLFGRSPAIRQRTTTPPMERFKEKDSLDPITLQNIDECNEWLTGTMQEQLVHEDGDLTWQQVEEASGANESDETDGEEEHYIENRDNDLDGDDDDMEDEALLHSIMDHCDD